MKRILKISSYVLLLAGVLVLLSFVNKKQNDVICWSLAVEIENDNQFHFIDKPMVLAKVYDLGDSVVGTKLTAINIERIRTTVLAMHGVDQAEVIKALDGQIKVCIQQRTPILRIQCPDGSGFYIDQKGEPMPLAAHYTARVPVAVGKFSFNANQVMRDWDQEIFPLINDLFRAVQSTSSSPLWQAQVDHFNVNENGDLEIIPRVGNHRIVLGDGKNVTQKLKKLEAFYNETVGKKDRNKYTVINLKYRDQVVCTKRPW